MSTPLTARFRDLVDTATRNEEILRKFQEIELRLIAARDLESLFGSLLIELPRIFDLSRVVLWFNEAAPSVRDLWSAETVSEDHKRHLSSGRFEDFNGLHPCANGRPWLGAVKHLDRSFRALVLSSDVVPASVAVLPLFSGETIVGCLCLCSNQLSRFTGDLRTDLLERFGKFASAAIDNVAQREQLKQLGMTDALTGIPNRRYFDARLNEEIQRAARYGSPVACLYIDVDHFKSINDSHGHAAGDAALAAIAGCIRKAVRQGDTVARYGGEEFVALVQGDAADAKMVAERVRLAVEAFEMRYEGATISLTVSVGVSGREPVTGAIDSSTTCLALLESADRAMYFAKRNGRNRVESESIDIFPAAVPAVTTGSAAGEETSAAAAGEEMMA